MPEENLNCLETSSGNVTTLHWRCVMLSSSTPKWGAFIVMPNSKVEGEGAPDLELLLLSA
jgi:hypothetical protein